MIFINLLAMLKLVIMQSSNTYFKIRMVCSLLLGLAVVYGLVGSIEKNALWLALLMGLFMISILFDLLVLYKKKAACPDKGKYLYLDAGAMCVWWILFFAVDGYFSLGVVCALVTITLVNDVLYHLYSR